MDIELRPDITAAMIVIGNEILSGRTADANLAMVARGLYALGIRLKTARFIPDDTAEIHHTVNELRHQHSYVFTTGGIGPTHDDITAAAIAQAFGVALKQHPQAVERLAAHYGGHEKLNPARLRMAMIPEGASLIDNPISSAPGFRLENVFVFAGVPAIARAMFDMASRQLQPGDKIHATTISCRTGESLLAEGLTTIQNRFPDVEIGSYPFFRDGKLGVSLVSKSTRPEKLQLASDAICALIESLGDVPVITAGQD